MKKLLLLTIMIAANVAGCKTVSLQIIDDAGKPVADAKVLIWFYSSVEKPSDKTIHESDVNGRVLAHGETTVGYYIKISKDGYYSAKSEPYIAPDELVERTYVLPRVLNPIPLCESPQHFYLKLPVQNEWLGFDLEAADWVSPNGKGKIADIRFRYKNEFIGYGEAFGDIEKEKAIVRSIKAKRGEVWSEEEFKRNAGKWRGVLEVSFPNPKEGLIEEQENYWYYNELRLPHRAPEIGYQPGKRYEANTYEPRQPEKLVGYYLRTRVKLDADGGIISANYAKIYDDIRFDARGTVSFWYYYNPTPNDRNLEFDPARNLFPQSMPGANVANP